MKRTSIEPLEQRIAPANFIVTSAADSGAGSLRAAIVAANGAAGDDTITFDIAGAQKIALLSALPAITDTVSILATPRLYADPPQIDLDGSGAGTADGFVINADGCKIEGFIVHGFSGNGISIAGKNNVISGNYIGLSADGTKASANGGDGIYISGDTNYVGFRSLDSAGNRISGNLGVGIHITGSAQGNQIAGNFIGADHTETVAIGNHVGIRIDGTAGGNQIGTGSGSSLESNYVAGNAANGIEIVSTGTGNDVKSNSIGLTQSSVLANGGDGLFLAGLSGSTISNNRVSGNTGRGIVISGGSGNTIDWNTIGNANGNDGDGLVIKDSPNNVITNNTVGANGGNGIVVSGAASSGNRLSTNGVGIETYLGTKYPNTKDGILIDGAVNTTIGSVEATDPSGANAIACNHGNGVHLTGGATGTTMNGNTIGFGLFRAFVEGSGNDLDGVLIDGGAHDNVVGIDSVNGNGGNTISFNSGDGIHIEGATSSGNSIVANRIGTDPFGYFTDYGNLGNGISVVGAPGVTIGGAVAGSGGQSDGNGILYSHGHGIFVSGATASGASITGNGIAGSHLDGIHVGASAGGFFNATALEANNAISSSGGVNVFVGTPQVIVRADHRAATWTDVDGDVVTLTASKPVLEAGQFAFQAGGAGYVLKRLDLTGLAVTNAGLGLTFTVKKFATGDGLVNVGGIDATGLDLGAVSVPGDLGQIDAGDANLATAGLASLTVGSLGVRGDTQAGGTLDPLHSTITGALGVFNAKHTLAGFLEVTGGTKSGLGVATIGGDLDGSAGGTAAGFIKSGTGTGAVTVKGSIIGGADSTGIVSLGKLGKVTVTHDVMGSVAKRVTIAAFGKAGAPTAADALAIAGVSIAGEMDNGRVIAGFNLTTGATDDPGAGIGPVTIGKSTKNGSIRATGAVGPVLIGGDLDGSIGGARAGLIEGDTGVGAVTIKGSIIGGADFTGVISGGKLGKLAVWHDIAGTSAKPVTIAALGKMGATTAAGALAITGIFVHGNVGHARVLAGYDPALAAVNPDASIGAVTVGGDWSASSLVAGVNDTSVAGNLGSGRDGFGRNDTPIGGDTTPALFASIASITIKQTASGSAVPSSDFFGITAQRLSKLTIGKTTTIFKNGTADDLLLDAANNDFRAVDFA